MATSTLPQPAKVHFLEHLEVERNLSPLTIRNYQHYLQRFIDWFKKHGNDNLKQLDLEILRKYRLFLNRYEDEHGERLSKATQSYHIIALRSWLKWLTKNDAKVLHPEKIDLPKAESTPMTFVSAEEMERVLAQPKVSKPIGLRDRAILETLFSTGLRVSELVNLDCDDIDLKRKEFGVIGKGRRQRVVFLSDRAAVWLERWLNSRDDHWQPLFIRFSGSKPEITSDGEEMRLTARSVQRLVKKHSKKAHLSVEITPHSIRHSFATDLLNNGAGLRDVQELLGHKNVATTQIYTHVTRPKLRKIHHSFHSDLNQPAELESDKNKEKKLFKK
ncbi:MAG: tyrosine-type recombinase/integrase [Patescibacteria group bacterium]|nr:tyrosine-type recombinase/integrase [Patescibacteria group bacterium]